jgi:hypothetical protein
VSACALPSPQGLTWATANPALGVRRRDDGKKFVWALFHGLEAEIADRPGAAPPL